MVVVDMMTISECEGAMAHRSYLILLLAAVLLGLLILAWPDGALWVLGGGGAVAAAAATGRSRHAVRAARSSHLQTVKAEEEARETRGEALAEALSQADAETLEVMAPTSEHSRAERMRRLQ